jgi:hypothetical protein
MNALCLLGAAKSRTGHAYFSGYITGVRLVSVFFVMVSLVQKFLILTYLKLQVVMQVEIQHTES